jgi:hypothetical protein
MILLLRPLVTLLHGGFYSLVDVESHPDDDPAPLLPGVDHGIYSALKDDLPGYQTSLLMVVLISLWDQSGQYNDGPSTTTIALAWSTFQSQP